MQSITTSTVAAVVCLASATALPVGARAEDQADDRAAQAIVAPPPSDPPRIEFLVNAYVWLPWTYVGVHPTSRLLPSASSIFSPYKFIKRITWAPFLGEAEVRSGAFGVLVDYLHAPLTAGVDSSRILLGAGRVGVGVDMGTAMFLYRPLRGPIETLDLGVGVRAWGFRGDLDLSRAPLPLPPIAVSSGSAFADPLIGARYRRDLGNGFSATAYGDVGGGPGGDLQWQVVATVDYKKTSWPELHFGFRDMSFNHTSPQTRVIVNMFGPVISSTFRF